MKPRIALPADTYHDATSVINMKMAPFAPLPAVEAVVQAGGIPVILPSVAPELVADYLGTFDGIAFLGGPDVDPTFYGAEPHQNLGLTYSKRDEFEFELFRQAEAADVPMLGICRGFHVINAALGGTLYQDLSEREGETLQHAQLAPGDLPTHHVEIEPDSVLADIMGSTGFVNSRHHQLIQTVAPSLKVTATAPDGVVEGLESRGDDQILAVQWHPENMFETDEASFAIFEDLVNRSKSV
ncbi:glutamine amidotransferase [Secundilactobacillus oryzae JCM 18671]|uniref:Glutamine amidotransferase n=1 Tax=Secundilactobacillus oryzae JCM 18671 TaxID=1291743 RepID=A0A081BGY1_9LACO|nr:gamma-glutamyl-gamma-aminobutyrate hydrolase family protein [Secundilactobacillus oryzae]GAK47299.1 glutamine amidotransferase [Secundilactobacillus oryzae JCM 18671]